MTIVLGALVRLGDCTKGSPYVPDALPMLLNGVVYPSFATITAGTPPLVTEVHLNGPDGATITITNGTVVDAGLATIVPFSLTSVTTAALTAERLWWSCRANDALNVTTPLCYGWIQVRPK